MYHIDLWCKKKRNFMEGSSQMNRTIFSAGTIAVWTLAAVLAILNSGCSKQEKKASMQEQNLPGTEEITVTEVQPAPAPMYTPAPAPAAIAPAAAAQPANPTSVYVVVKGDTLWSIAQRKLGSGNRYKEILALNPQLQQNKPLAIGTKLTLPAK
jgi:nucleoid-associated protein YgaU